MLLSFSDIALKSYQDVSIALEAGGDQNVFLPLEVDKTEVLPFRFGLSERKKKEVRLQKDPKCLKLWPLFWPQRLLLASNQLIKIQYLTLFNPFGLYSRLHIDMLTYVSTTYVMKYNSLTVNFDLVFDFLRAPNLCT